MDRIVIARRLKRTVLAIGQRKSVLKKRRRSMSPIGTFRTSCNVRLGSGMRAKADVHRPL
jgi:hypothetical protein